MKYNFRILEEKEVFRGFFKVTRYLLDYDYFSGGSSGPVMRECLGKKGRVVSALVYIPAEDSFVFVEQFRVGMMAAGENPWNLEIVAGFMDKPEETPEEAMRRELEEEIGCAPQTLTQITTYFGSPGGSGGRTFMYFATVNAEKLKTYTGLHAEGEDILVHKMPRQEALKRLEAQAFDNATIILALQYFKLHEAQLLASIPTCKS